MAAKRKIGFPGVVPEDVNLSFTTSTCKHDARVERLGNKVRFLEDSKAMGRARKALDAACNKNRRQDSNELARLKVLDTATTLCKQDLEFAKNRGATPEEIKKLTKKVENKEDEHSRVALLLRDKSNKCKEEYINAIVTLKNIFEKHVAEISDELEEIDVAKEEEKRVTSKIADLLPNCKSINVEHVVVECDKNIPRRANYNEKEESVEEESDEEESNDEHDAKRYKPDNSSMPDDFEVSDVSDEEMGKDRQDADDAQVDNPTSGSGVIKFHLTPEGTADLTDPGLMRVFACLYGSDTARWIVDTAASP